jgi:putative membrane protein
MARERFPASVYAHGDEPDARFTLANERTFLAWIRTSLALMAGGVGLEALGLGLQPQLRLAASVVLMIAGLLTPLQAWFGWARNERALRQNTPLPSSIFALPTMVAVIVAGVLVLLGIVLR